jgi:hypothetical protein
MMMTARMKDAIRQFNMVGSVYAALTIVEEAKAAGMTVITACTIHQAEDICSRLGCRRQWRAEDYIPDIIGMR